MSTEVIDLSTQEDIICISDDDHEVKKAKANQVYDTERFDDVEEIEVLEKSESPPQRQSQSRVLSSKNEIDIESLKLAFQKTLQERKSMGCTKTPPPIKPLKFRQKTWSQLKSEKEKEKMVMSPKMPRLNREPVYISSESENEEEEEELPDLDDYSEVINISDDETGELSGKKSVLSLNCTSLDSDNESKTSIDRSSYCISTDEDEEGTTVVMVQIVSCSEDTDDTTYSSPKCKRRKMSNYLPDRSLADYTENKTEDDCDLEIISEEIEKEDKTEVVQKIWTDENKTKLANLLNGVKTTLNLKNKSALQDQKESELKETAENSKSVLREISNSPTSSRHFTDLLKCDDSEDSETEYVQVKKRRRKNKMRKIVKKEDSDCGQITSYFSMKKDIHKKCFWQRHKSNIVNSRLDSELENALVGAFSQFHINTVEGCWEDEQNPSFMRHGLKFLKNFSHSYSPPLELIERVIEQGIISSNSLELLKESVDCLMLVFDKYPEMLHIDFKHLQDSLERLNFGKSFSDQSHLLVSKTAYLLRLVILFYEYELTTRNVSDPKAMRKTASYKALSYDCGFNNVKELIVNYIVPLLHHEQTFQNEIPEILPLLQKLLHISVEVSSNCNAAAKAIALELSKPYCYLPTIDHKKLYIQTLESTLLRYYLVTVVLERQCENTAPCYDFPCRFQDVFNCFFQAYPPTNISTPPTTPQSEDDSMDNYPNSTAGYPAINVEELLMLLFEVLQCYVQCEQDKSIATLRRRAYMKKEDFTMQLTDKDKDLIFQGIEELRGRVLTLTPDLTPVSEKYLQLMLCVVDWQKCMN